MAAESANLKVFEQRVFNIATRAAGKGLGEYHERTMESNNGGVESQRVQKFVLQVHNAASRIASRPVYHSLRWAVSDSGPLPPCM